MTSPRSVPRLLQQQPAHDTPDDRVRRAQQQEGEREFQPAPPGRRGASASQKGDRRSPLEQAKPSREREVGDLEESERESHGRAGRPGGPP